MVTFQGDRDGRPYHKRGPSRSSLYVPGRWQASPLLDKGWCWSSRVLSIFIIDHGGPRVWYYGLDTFAMGIRVEIRWMGNLICGNLTIGR